ncbi:hypothetical protein DBR42_05770 [Pelomonas sp. HMWF004]|nr:hypothetical protein DBR42_05770 [Pelomonas sp. HMWF004]
MSRTRQSSSTSAWPQGNIEERLLEIQARQKALAEGLPGSNNAARLTTFSAPDLQRLAPPAVVRLARRR